VPGRLAQGTGPQYLGHNVAGKKLVPTRQNDPKYKPKMIGPRVVPGRNFSADGNAIVTWRGAKARNQWPGPKCRNPTSNPAARGGKPSGFPWRLERCEKPKKGDVDAGALPEISFRAEKTILPMLKDGQIGARKRWAASEQAQQLVVARAKNFDGAMVLRTEARLTFLFRARGDSTAFHRPLFY